MSLIDKDKVLHHDKLLCGVNALPSVRSVSYQHPKVAEVLPQARRFSDTQRRYLDCTFEVWQETRLKIDREDLSRDMRYARNRDGEQLFIVTRKSSKLQRSQSDDADSEEEAEVDEDLTSLEEVAHENIRAILWRSDIQLFMTLMHKAGKRWQLSVLMLRSICEYFHIEKSNIKG